MSLSPFVKKPSHGALLFVVMAAAAFPLHSATAGGPHALYIMDANTGATLTDQEGSDPRYPASLTKMMTLYMAFDALEQRRADLKTRIKISQQAANAQPSKLELPPGDDIALEDAISALITKSANDVAIAVAEHLGGTEANFAKLMTAKARDLGMKNTTFKNASGLPDSSQVTTARDMATLGVRLYDDFPRYFPLFATKSFAYNGATHKNHNTLMLQMPGINGIKTGYTNASGFNLVTSYEHDGKHLVGAIFGGQTAGTRNATMRIALSKALSRASTTKTRKPVLVARAEAKAAEVKASEAKAAETKAAEVKAAEARRKMAMAAEAARKAAVAAAPVAVAAVAPVAPPQTAPAAPKIEVAKVRQIDVANAPPVQPLQPQSEPAATPAFAQASVSPRVSDVLKTRVVPKAATEPAASDAPRQPSSFQHQMSALAQNIAPPAPAATPAVVQPVAPEIAAPAQMPVAAGVRPPSSLNAQFAQLTAAPVPAAAPSAPVAQPNVRLKGAGAQASKGYEIQIGAYVSAAEAEKRLAAAAAQVPSVLQGHTPSRQTVTVNDKTLYRARFAGFDAASAATACAELTRQAINCIALKVE